MVCDMPACVPGCIKADKLRRSQLVPAGSGVPGLEKIMAQTGCGEALLLLQVCREWQQDKLASSQRRSRRLTSEPAAATEQTSHAPTTQQPVPLVPPDAKPAAAATHPPVAILQLHVNARDAPRVCCRTHHGAPKALLQLLIAAHVVVVVVRCSSMVGAAEGGKSVWGPAPRCHPRDRSCGGRW